MADLTPRARTILEAVEREVAARLGELAPEREEAAALTLVRRPPAPERAPSAAPAAGVRPRPELLAALELGVAGMPRDAVAERLRAGHGLADPEPVLDAVFGAGSPPRATLRRVTSGVPEGPARHAGVPGR